MIETARREGMETSVMFGPLLPFLSDSQASIDALLKRAAELEVDAIWVDALNPRPRVWPAVADLLRAEFPDLLPLYRRILFDQAGRAEYLDGLRTRIDLAAEPDFLNRSDQGMYVNRAGQVPSVRTMKCRCLFRPIRSRSLPTLASRYA